MTAVRRRMIVLAAGAVALVLAAPVGAKTFEVTKRGDPTPNACKKKDCSLREAVIAANNHGGADKVVLPKKKPYGLSIENVVPGTDDDGAATGDLDVTDDLKVNHPGKGRAKVDANGIDRAFELLPGAPTSFKRIVVTGGDDGDDEGGGGILATDANVSLRRSSVSHNHADGNYGGGLELDGTAALSMVRSALSFNTSNSDSGGIEAGEGPITIERSKLIGNRADGSGGAMYGDTGDSLIRIVQSTIADNEAQDGNGGGFHASGPVAVDRSTISGNSASTEGGGVQASDEEDTLVITNSTVSGNHAAGDGGGVWSSADASVNAITVARNTSSEDGGGLYYPSGSPGFEVENSLIALNAAAGVGTDCFAEVADPFDSQGHNLLGDDSDCDGFGATGDLVNPDPGLAQLKSNGGPTQTIALQKGSPAINKANKPSAPKKDQRGVKRGKKPDIGAYERVKKKKHHHHHHH
jgi:hypothetical protein